MAGTFFGWRVVAVAFAVAVFSYGNAVYGPGVWLHALARERGWSLAFVSACTTLHFLASAAVAARLPALHARLGLARRPGWACSCLRPGVPAGPSPRRRGSCRLPPC
jgi:hypothetical protein